MIFLIKYQYNAKVFLMKDFNLTAIVFTSTVETIFIFDSVLFFLSNLSQCHNINDKFVRLLPISVLSFLSSTDNYHTVDAVL